MQMVMIEDLCMTADNFAGAEAVFKEENSQYRAELRIYLQGNDCLAVHVGRHDRSILTSKLEDYLFTHKIEIRKQISAEVPRLRKEYKQMLIDSHADINWSAINNAN